MIFPRWRSSILLPASWHSRKALVRFTCRTCFQASNRDRQPLRGESCLRCSPECPARPSPRSRWKEPVGPLVVSEVCGKTPPLAAHLANLPGCLLRRPPIPVKATAAPASASARAIAAPSPLAAPVTRAVIPSSLKRSAIPIVCIVHSATRDAIPECEPAKMSFSGRVPGIVKHFAYGRSSERAESALAAGKRKGRRALLPGPAASTSQVVCSMLCR